MAVRRHGSEVAVEVAWGQADGSQAGDHALHEVLSCAASSALRYIGDEVIEQIDYEPVRFFCCLTIRKKYVRRDEPH